MVEMGVGVHVYGLGDGICGWWYQDPQQRVYLELGAVHVPVRVVVVVDGRPVHIGDLT